jgi:hypothetical protein
MTMKLTAGLLALSLLAACQSTNQTAANRGTLEQRMIAQNGANPNTIGHTPAPPAEGPEDVPAEGPIDPNRNPGLLPTPLLRANAARGL